LGFRRDFVGRARRPGRGLVLRNAHISVKYLHVLTKGLKLKLIPWIEKPMNADVPELRTEVNILILTGTYGDCVIFSKLTKKNVYKRKLNSYN